MDRVSTFLGRLYSYPRTLLIVLGAALLAAGAFWPRFEFDASSDTLVIEGDPALAYYREISRRFSDDEFLILTYQPEPTQGSVFSQSVLNEIAALEAELESFEGVTSVFSILDAPLLETDRGGLSDLREHVPTLRDEGIDLDQAAAELTSSPLFAGLLVAQDGSTTALRIDLEPTPRLDALLERRTELWGRDDLTDAEEDELEAVESAYAEERIAYRDQREVLIDRVRELRASFQNGAVLHLGGIPMIASDMIDFVRSDVVVFGSGVALVVLLMLWLFFRRLRWVLLPVATSAISIGLVIGLLGYLDQPVTVVSSNFVSLLAIITISFTIHLIVRYRELVANDDTMAYPVLVCEVMRSKFAPCLYTALTTMVAFASLLSARIVPVEDFGWMMCVGILISFLVTFSFFPAALMVMGAQAPSKTLGRRLALTERLSYLTRRHYKPVLGVGLITALLAAVGVAQLSLDNRFIDYFRADTEIRRGMIYIDQHLGGTVPFDVILEFEPYESPELEESDDFFVAETDEPYPERYWFTPHKIESVRRMQEHLARQPQVGNLISLADVEAVARELNDGDALDAAQLALALGEIPTDMRELVIEPYASPGTGELRISGRVKESGPVIDRDKFIAGIEDFAVDELGLAPEDVHVTGMLVLFNDTLKQLFDSQTSTIGAVLLTTLAMFWILLRSFKLAAMGLLPNVLAAATVLAIMGYAGIPLDIMTITIAAISIGIGVDNAIHYLHRYREERRNGCSIEQAIRIAHAHIGRALYFTGMTIIAGFSILAFSNFIPTVYFGLFTALAMALALIANLTVLPSLLMYFSEKTNRAVV